MSKIAILKTLPTPADLRDSVQQIQQALDQSSQRLDSVTNQVQELNQLPDLITEQVTTALAPLATMRQDLASIMLAFDQVTAAQRMTLDALALEISSKATAQMEAKTKALDESIQSLTASTDKMFSGIKVSMDLLSEKTATIAALPEKLKADLALSSKDLKTESKQLIAAAKELKTQTDRARSNPWKVWGQLMAVALASAVITLTGQAVLSWLMLPNQQQQNTAQTSYLAKKPPMQIAPRPGQ